MTIRAVVKGVGHYLPERVVPNADLETLVETTDEWIRTRSGIERRHYAAEGQTTSDLGTRAAQAALADAGLTADDIDAIILATSTADLTFPSAATMIQGNLGMTRGFAFDVQAVCAGFVFALTNANALIVTGQAKRVLVIGAETFSRLMDWKDRSTCVLFGDGAGALVLEAAEGDGTTADRGVLATDLNSDGRFRDLLYVDGGTSTGVTGHLRMEGKEVFRHAVEKLAQTAHTALEKVGLVPLATTGYFAFLKTQKDGLQPFSDIDWVFAAFAFLYLVAVRMTGTAQWMEKMTEIYEQAIALKSKREG